MLLAPLWCREETVEVECNDDGVGIELLCDDEWNGKFASCKCKWDDALSGKAVCSLLCNI